MALIDLGTVLSNAGEGQRASRDVARQAVRDLLERRRADQQLAAGVGEEARAGAAFPSRLRAAEESIEASRATRDPRLQGELAREGAYGRALGGGLGEVEPSLVEQRLGAATRESDVLGPLRRRDIFAERLVARAGDEAALEPDVVGPYVGGTAAEGDALKRGLEIGSPYRDRMRDFQLESVGAARELLPIKTQAEGAAANLATTRAGSAGQLAELQAGVVATRQKMQAMEAALDAMADNDPGLRAAEAEYRNTVARWRQDTDALADLMYGRPDARGRRTGGIGGE